MRKPRKNPNPQPASQAARIARDWAAQPPKDQKTYASQLLQNYFKLSRVANPNREVRESLQLVKDVLAEYQKLLKPGADDGFVNRLLAMMDATVRQGSPDLGIRSVKDIERLVPLQGGLN